MSLLRPGRLLALLALGLALALAPAALADTAELAGAAGAVEVDFGREILFTLEAPWDGPEPVSATVFYGLPDGALRTFARAEDLAVVTGLTASYSWDIRDVLVPGAEIEYHWRVTDAAGEQFTSAPAVFVYEDSSLPWEIIANEDVEVRWYAGGQAFGERVLGVTVDALARLEDTFQMRLEHQTRIIIYADGDLMREALGGGTSQWVGGQAIGPFNVIVFNATPTTTDLDMLLAHELTHIVIDQVSDNPFSSPPSWIHEGLATINETTGDLRFDYPGIVDDALGQDSLLSLRGLTGSFPASSGGAILAYAESNSLVNYVIATYGAESIGRLLGAYRDGVTDDQAVQAAIGISLDRLERQWLAWLRGEELPADEVDEAAPAAAATPASAAGEAPAPATPATPAPVAAVATPGVVVPVAEPVPSTADPAPATSAPPPAAPVPTAVDSEASFPTGPVLLVVAGVVLVGIAFRVARPRGPA
jgi:hypothetical protein